MVLSLLCFCYTCNHNQCHEIPIDSGDFHIIIFQWLTVTIWTKTWSVPIVFTTRYCESQVLLAVVVNWGCGCAHMLIH